MAVRVSIEAPPAYDAEAAGHRSVHDGYAERQAGLASQPQASQATLGRLLLATKRVRSADDYAFEKAVTQIDLDVLWAFLQGTRAAVVDPEHSVLLSCGDEDFETPPLHSPTSADPCWQHVVRGAYEFASCWDSRREPCSVRVNVEEPLLRLQIRELTVYFRLRGDEAAPALFGIYYGAP